MSDDIVTRLRLWATVEGEDSSVTDDLNASADEIEQLRKELKQVRKDKDHLRKIADKAFTLAGGCITGCRGACMCTCGYEHWLALQHKKN